jgi:hypothetical protein
MIELAAGIVLENGADDKGRSASMQVLTKNLLGLGKGKPVRQLKKAGAIFISVEQHLQIHISGAKIGKGNEATRHKGKYPQVTGFGQNPVS